MTCIEAESGPNAHHPIGTIRPFRVSVSEPDCAELERRLGTGIGLLVSGGASRGNLLSGEAEEVILTVSRMEAEKSRIPAIALLRERRERHPDAGAVRLGGHPRVVGGPPRHPA